MDLLALLPKDLLRGRHGICRANESGFVSCAFVRHDAPIDATGPLAVEHGLYGLSLTLAGSGAYRDRNGESHALAPGAICQFSEPPGTTMARTIPDPGFFEVTVSFQAGIGERLAKLGIWRSDFLHAATEPSAALVTRYLELYRRMVAAPVSYHEALRALISIVDVAYSHASTAHRPVQRMREACRLLSERTEPDYNSRSVAVDLGIPYETFRRMFVRHAGMPPHAYQLRQRMNLACEWLRTAAVKEVSARLGYSNAFIFSRQFKKIIGVSPKTFRR
jgi:AraC-like DNA-binding protein